MKSTTLTVKRCFLLILPVLLFSLFWGCDKIDSEGTYIAKIPIYKTLREIRASNISIAQPQPMTSTGKIYLYRDYLLVNEPNKGIHIYDNSNPATPKPLGFLPILGNFDLGVQNNLLYVDNIVDLLTFDISDISKPVLVNRQKDVFAVKYIVDNKPVNVLRDDDPVPVAYRDSLVSFADHREYKPDGQRYLDYESIGNNYSGSNGSGTSGNTVGQAGSLARFAIAENFLFAIFQDKVKNFDLQNARAPKLINEVSLGFGIETLFPYKKSLFVGANNGMHILDITNPTSPKELANYSHAFACDPVVVNDDFAFVTLRTGTICNGNVNALQVVNIRDLSAPQLVKSYNLKSPHGLALTGEHLYVCEGESGLKSFKVTDVTAIDKNIMQNLENLKSFDVIAGPKSLIVLGPEGICQYDYTNKANLKQLSCISINLKK
ncbi:LVIVD repeat-containing protein [Sphingobacterium mizutaii]|uniref:LVIVD repeat-containing protein n=1 Tax=Sphingobacterium mizutaii TaxID=1010 RepID=UPI00162749F9|nr:hypothetical protein [Sphingobacterium mizutaii]